MYFVVQSLPFLCDIRYRQRMIAEITIDSIEHEIFEHVTILTILVKMC